MKKLIKVFAGIAAYIVIWILLVYISFIWIDRTGYGEAGKAMSALIVVSLITIGLPILLIVIGIVQYLIRNRSKGFNFIKAVLIAVLFIIGASICFFTYKHYVSIQNEGLRYAIEKGQLEDVKKFIGAGADVNDRGGDSYRTSVLMDAIMDNKPEIAEILIAHGADVNAKFGSGSGVTALMHASSSLALTKLLLNHGADVNARNDYDGSTAIMMAENPDVIKLLIDHGVDLNIRNKEGKTARMILLEKGYLEK